MIKEYDIHREKPPATPLLDDLPPHEGDIDEARVHIYRKEVGSICYSAIMTRSDVAKAASKLAEFLNNPGEIHVRAADLFGVLSQLERQDCTQGC